MGDAAENPAFGELMAIRGGTPPRDVRIEGEDPVLATRFALGETAAAVMAALGVAAADLWEQRTDRRQSVTVDANHAAATLKSYAYMRLAGDPPPDPAATPARFGLTSPHPTKDGRFFLPHFGLPHLGERVRAVLGCDEDLDSVRAAIRSWDALDLENAIAEARGCGAMVRSNAEWLTHPHGRALAAKPVVEITRIADSDPEPMPAGDRPLAGIRALDLTRILAGPTCARTLAEHGADVLMVTAPHLPQADRFVMDTGHGKRTCYLDFNDPAQLETLHGLVRDADVFSQGYRPGVLAARGLSPEALAEMRPGIVYTSMNCYGYDGPFRERAGWEQLAQTVTGIAEEHGVPDPALLPAAACDYTTGYLAAFGTLVALARRAVEGGSWHVRASLCQSGMFLCRQRRVDFEKGADVPQAKIDEIAVTSETPYGQMQHLGPILRLSETQPRWDLPTSPLGTHDPVWLT